VSRGLNLYSAALPTSDTDPVAVIGASGALGFGLALRLARAGVPVAVGSRDLTRASETVERARAALPEGICTAHDNAGAVRLASVVILSVPFRNQSETLTNLSEALRPGQLLIDATVPLAAAVSGKATRMLGVWQGSAAEQAAEMVPEGVRVVSALHTVSAPSLSDLAYTLHQDVLLCGDSRADKRQAAGLLERIEGLRCVDCGPLEMARITESLTALLISVNARYKVHAGIRLTGLPDRLER
jgi:8-hydroxy-5-deazaflavin:NADPH oxidoreductase